MEKVPSSAAFEKLLVPFCCMVAWGTASPLFDFTVPVTVRAWANDWTEYIKHRNITKRDCIAFFIFSLFWLGQQTTKKCRLILKYLTDFYGVK
jgi:hypothetical protein